MKYRFVRFVSGPWLDTDIPSKHFVYLQGVFKTSSRHVFKTYSRHVLKASSRHVFKTSSRHVFKTSSRCLQHNNFSPSKTSSRRLQDAIKTYLQDVFKASGKTKIFYAEDVLNTSSRPFEEQKLFAGRLPQIYFRHEFISCY